MLICKNGIKDDFKFYIDSENAVLIRKTDVLIKKRGINVRLCKDLDKDAINILLSALKKGYYNIYYKGYLLVYNIGYGYGLYRILKINYIDDILSEKTLQFLYDKISQDEYSRYMEKLKTIKDLKGFTIATVDEFSLLTGNTDWNLFDYKVNSLENCYEMNAKISDKIEIGNLSFEIKKEAEFIDLAGFITLFNIFNGNYVGNFEIPKGEGYIYKSFNEVKITNIGNTKICGTIRLPMEKPCAFGDGISIYSDDMKILNAVINDINKIKEISDKLK